MSAVILEPLSSASAPPSAMPNGPGRVLLRASGVTKAYGGRVVLRDVQATLRQGEVVLLRGDNGSGKTTLLNILSGNLAPDRGTLHLSANGSVETFRFPRRWWQDLNPADHFLPERVAQEGFGRSWQETRLFQTLRLVDNVAVAEPHHPGENPLNVLFRPNLVNLAEVAAQAGAADLLQVLGLNGRAKSSADMISLGQTKRVAIARAARAGGKVLFLDEPLAGLDADGIQTVMHLLRQLATEHHVTLVIIEHVWNAHHILGLATTLWTLRDGALITEPPDFHTGSDVVAHRNAAPDCLPQLLTGLRCVETQALPRGASLAIYRAPDGAETGECLLEVDDVAVRRGRRWVIGDDGPAPEENSLSFHLHDGDLAILQAPNGWGKTTLLDALAGLLPVIRGRLRLLGKDMTRSRSWDRSRAGMHLLRTGNRVFPTITVDETFALSGSGTPPESLTHLRRQNMGQLSGGEQQAVSLGQVDASGKHVFLLDEPFSALDVQHVSDTFATVRELARRERTAVLLAVPVTSTRTRIS